MKNSEAVTRGDLPHWYKPGHAHFITYRLYDSIPPRLLKQWREERQRMIKRPCGQGDRSKNAERSHKLYFTKYDRFLDSRATLRWLADHQIADIIRENLYHHNGQLYSLLCWCVMPNHVHLLIQPLERSTPTASSDGQEIRSDEVSDNGSPLTRIMHSLKSYTSNRANALLNRSGRFWQRESYDHWVRDIDELQRIVDYIRMNPVKAGLIEKPEEYRYSSAFDRFQRDGSRCGLVGWLRDDWKP